MKFKRKNKFNKEKKSKEKKSKNTGLCNRLFKAKNISNL